MSKPNICILHDMFLYRGGGERLIMMMGKALGADIASGFFDAGSLDLRQEGFEGALIPVSSPTFKKGFRHIALKFAFLFKTGFLKQYDRVVFSGDCISGVRNARKDAVKIYYCHTPPRYIFDQRDAYLEKIAWYIRPVYLLVLSIFRWMYLRDISKMDRIFTNSENTRMRLKRFTGYDSEIIYPPADLSLFVPSEIRGDYYLSFARLASIKRVDRIVKAFQQLPDKKLIFTHGPNDPQKDEILALAKGYPNISVRLSPSDEELKKLISESIATIYIPVDEDFGMSPVESMGCGVPVIGVADGGLKESIIDGKTGILLSKEATIEELKKAIQTLDIEKSLTMKDDCVQQAKRFSLEQFNVEVRGKMLDEGV